MEKHIQTVSGHLVTLLVCLIAVLGTQVHAFNLIKVESAVEKGAVCLDGTPPSYYHDQGVGEGVNNWVVFFAGGGWCPSVSACMVRENDTQYSLGSSSYLPLVNDFAGLLSPNQTQNPDFYNWNKVRVNYCDGGSFSGEVEEVDPSNKVYFRGARIFTAIVEELLAKGLKDADNVILSGQSAGGLTVMLHCDQFRALVPNAKRLKCLSDGGYFIQGKDIPGGTEATIRNPYGDTVETQGIDKFLPKSCTSKMDAKLCFYPENIVGDIKTPLFLLNGAFDRFQVPRKVLIGSSEWRNCDFVQSLCTQPQKEFLDCLVNATICTASQIELMKEFRTSFLKALPKGDCSLIGMFIDSSTQHDHLIYSSTWSGPQAPKLKNKTPAEAFADWYFDRSNCFQEIDPQDTPHNYWDIHA